MAVTASPTNSVTQDTQKSRSRLASAFYRAIGWSLETFIELLVRFTGRRVCRADASWLDCPLGDSVLIGTGIYDRIAREENLELRLMPDAGLIADFSALGGPSFDSDLVHPRVRHFYEHRTISVGRQGVMSLLSASSSCGSWSSSSVSE